MGKIDARTLSQEVQEALRRQVVRLRKKGRSNNETAEVVGISVSHASKVWQSFKKEGLESIGKKTRGRRYGAQRDLTHEQEAEIKKLLIDKRPDQLKLAFALWTRDAVKLLIQQRFEYEMPIRTVGEYLKRWGFTPQKPAKWAKEQSAPAVIQWRMKQYPMIAARAKLENAEIHWGDETGLQTGANVEKGYSPKGKTPYLRQPSKRERVNMISSVTNQGKIRFMFYRENMNGQRLIEFMRRLTDDVERKVFLVLDNLKVHHSSVVRTWLERNKSKIEVFFLPSYSPELNPDEYLNNDLKGHVHSGKRANNGKQLEEKARKHMRTLQNRPTKTKKFFEHTLVAYAA